MSVTQCEAEEAEPTQTEMPTLEGAFSQPAEAKEDAHVSPMFGAGAGEEPKKASTTGVFTPDVNTRTDSPTFDLPRKTKGPTINYPLTGDKALKMYPHLLSEDEKEELKKVKSVYYLGENCSKPKSKTPKVYDDKDQNYIVEKHDHVRFRYELLEPLGKGSFGIVVKAYDHREKKAIALKIIKNEKKFHF